MTPSLLGALLAAGTCAGFAPRLLCILGHLLQEALLGLIPPLRRHLIYNSLNPDLLLPQLPRPSRQTKVSARPARSCMVQPHRCHPGSACPGASYASDCLRISSQAVPSARNDSFTQPTPTFPPDFNSVSPFPEAFSKVTRPMSLQKAIHDISVPQNIG